MFNLDYLQYVIFGILAIPPFVIGFKKGWKAALFSSIILFALSGLIIIISYAIYDDVLWPIFRNTFISKNIANGFDANQLKDISKPSITVTVLGIMIAPSIFITWLVYFAFKKLLLKHMKPRVEKINENQIKIWRKKNMFSKIIGGTILGANGVIVASTAASAVSTFTVPTNKENFFNKLTTLLSKGYSYNTGYYDSSYQDMYEYLPMTNKVAEMAALKRILSLEDGNSEVKTSDINLIINSKEWYEKTKNIFSNKNTALILVKLVIEETNRYDLTNNDFDIYLDNLKNTIGNAKLKFNMPNDVADAVTEHILKIRFLDFIETLPYEEWDTANKRLIHFKEQLSNLMYQKKSLLVFKDKLAKDMSELIHDKDVVQPNLRDKNELLKIKWKDIAAIDKVKYEQKEQLKDTAENEKDIALANYNSAATQHHRNSADYEEAKTLKTNNDLAIKKLKEDISKIQERIQDNEAKLIKADKEYKRLMAIYNDHNNSQDVRDKAFIEAQVEKNNMADAEGALIVDRNDKIIYESELSTKESSVANLIRDMESKKTLMDQSKIQEDSKRIIYQDKSDIFQVAENEWYIAFNKYQESINNFNEYTWKYNAAIDRIKSLIDILIPNKQNQIDSNALNIVNIAIEISDKEADIVIATDEEKNKRIEKDKWNATYIINKEKIRKMFKSALK